jgi:hypothetical protein
VTAVLLALLLARPAVVAAGPPPRPRPAPFAANEGSVRAPLPIDYVPLTLNESLDLAAVSVPDRPRATALAERVARATVLVKEDVDVAEGLFSRQRGVLAAWRLLRAVHVRMTEQARAAHDPGGALVHLRRLAEAAPEVAVDVDILVLLLEQGSWREAELAARTFANDRDDDVRGPLALAYALLRQDRAREALEVLEAMPAATAAPRGGELLARVRRALAGRRG